MRSLMSFSDSTLDQERLPLTFEPMAISVASGMLVIAITFSATAETS